MITIDDINLRRTVEYLDYDVFYYNFLIYRLTTQQLYSRRRGLESYLEQILAVKIIFESQIVQEWLNRTED